MNINYDSIMVRYGELSTKGKNRKVFISKLLSNIKNRLLEFTSLEYKASHDGIFIKLNNHDYNDVKNALKQVFGYSYFQVTIACDRDIEKIKEACLKIALKNNLTSFKVVSKRQDKSYLYHSDDINRLVAGHILKNSNYKVDVKNPELKIYISIRSDKAYIGDEKVSGIWGYPTGINGKALVMMSGGIDSPVASFLTMKRGLKIECIHFESSPYTSKQAIEKVKELCKIIAVYQGKITLHIVPFTDLQLEIYKNVAEPYCVTIMRRMMYRIADRIANARKIELISNGESIGQVASQTIESMSVISKVCEKLILRPCATYDKLEIIDIAKKLNTYETSILPYQDCCTIFEPKNPVTKPKLDKCLFYESKFDYDKLIVKAIENTNYEVISYKDFNELDLF